MDELKFFDTTLSFSFDATAEVPATGQLCLIPQGNTQSTRDGRHAVVESIEVRAKLNFAIAAAAAPISGCTRLALVVDTQCNGAAAAVTDVYSVDLLPEGFRQLNNEDRFRVLRTWTHRWGVVAGATTAYAVTPPVYIEEFVPVLIPIDWNSTTGALTEIRSNNIFLMAQANSGQGNIDDLVTFAGVCRLRFRG